MACNGSININARGIERHITALGDNRSINHGSIGDIKIDITSLRLNGKIHIKTVSVNLQTAICNRETLVNNDIVVGLYVDVTGGLTRMTIKTWRASIDINKTNTVGFVYVRNSGSIRGLEHHGVDILAQSFRTTTNRRR